MEANVAVAVVVFYVQVSEAGRRFGQGSGCDTAGGTAGDRLQAALKEGV
jgi:hypothetical protein